MTANVQETLTDFISRELLAGRTLHPQDNLLSDGAVDSVGMVRLAAFLNEAFGLSVPPEDFVIENFRTVESLGNYVSQRLPDA